MKKWACLLIAVAATTVPGMILTRGAQEIGLMEICALSANTAVAAATDEIYSDGEDFSNYDLRFELGLRFYF